jgi:glycosyltransferase involved in cell wall biosynthesis
VTTQRQRGAAARVAVIVPVYNAAGFVVETIESILQQSFQDFVIVAVDDGSTDDSLAVLQSIDDQRLRVISQPNSGGPASPRNVGIANSGSEYVAIFDSDDLMVEDKLAVSIAALDACPEAGFLISDFGRVDEQGARMVESFLEPYAHFQRLVAAQMERDGFVYLPPRPMFDVLCRENYVGTSSVVIRRAVLGKVGGFDESLRNCDDRDMWFRLTREFGAVYVPRALHYYRKRDGNISSRGPVINTEAKIKVLARQLEDPLSKENRRQLRERIAENHLWRAYHQRKQGERLASARSFARAFRLAPRFRRLLAAVKSLVAPGA